MKNLCENPLRFSDNRGFLEVLYEDDSFVVKRSFTLAYTFRGLHHQRRPHTQKKIIRVVSGHILDFWMPIIKNEEIPQIFYKTISPSDGWCFIDDDLAHGFLTLKDTQFEYACIGAYSEADETVYNMSKLLRQITSKKINFSAKDLAGSVIDAQLVEIT